MYLFVAWRGTCCTALSLGPQHWNWDHFSPKRTAFNNHVVPYKTADSFLVGHVLLWKCSSTQFFGFECRECCRASGPAILRVQCRGGDGGDCGKLRVGRHDFQEIMGRCYASCKLPMRRRNMAELAVFARKQGFGYCDTGRVTVNITKYPPATQSPTMSNSFFLEDPTPQAALFVWID